ncbi:MAG: sigma 54-interacting transcriptional regulator [Acidobacteriota bacterium]|nr:sigma 54-interacting transcriptional regulator [Acidobacteriota bacterium]
MSRLFLGQKKKIPVFIGDYTSAGRLIQGIEALLKNAAKKGDRNIYIIGANEGVFQALWEKVSTGTSTKATPKKQREGAIHQNTRNGEYSSTQHLLELLSYCDVPDELRQTYIGESVEAQLVRQLIIRAAQHGEAVLIVGDTGTGKEVIARAIHDYSTRRDKKYGVPRARTFVAVNCGAIPRDLFEAELFGSIKGVATDVMTRAGLWELAGNGTLFLDEIGDLSLNHQAKILRALQEKKVRRIGEAEEREVKARVLAATNRDLFSMVRARQFREDLYYRLRSFTIRTPTLRNHSEDIRLLASFLWKKISRDDQTALPEEMLSKLCSYGWPGNVRELKAVLLNIYTLFGKENIGVEQLDAVFQLQGIGGPSEPARSDEFSLHRMECLRHLRRVDEVVRACQVALKPIVEGGKLDDYTAASVKASLGQRLGELELLCLRPLLFQSELAFSVIYRLKGKLSYLHNLLGKDVGLALNYWRSDLSEEFKLALSAIFREVEELTGKI